MKRSKTDRHTLRRFSTKAEKRPASLPGLILCFCCLLALPYATAAQAGQRDAGVPRSEYRDALTLYNEGATDKAIEMMREVVKNAPQDGDAYEEMGYMLLKKGDFDGALSAFRSALGINPRMRTARTGVGLTLYEKGNLDAAQSALNDALSLNPYPSRAHYALGLVYEARKDYEKAIREYKEGLKTYVPGKK